MDESIGGGVKEVITASLNKSLFDDDAPQVRSGFGLKRSLYPSNQK